MLAALDEAIGQVQKGFEAKGMWAHTLTIFSTDNGGPVGSLNGHPRGIGCATGSQNFPLRGGKGCFFQGGVLGTSFVHGAMLASTAAGSTNMGLMHVVDWVPTLISAAGGDASTMSPTGKPLDGVSQWAMLTQGQASLSARTELLINIERDKPTWHRH